MYLAYLECILIWQTQKDMCIDDYVYRNKRHTEYKLFNHISVNFNRKEQEYQKIMPALIINLSGRSYQYNYDILFVLCMATLCFWN